MTNGHALAGALGALLSWLATAFWRLPLLWFLPLENRGEWGASVQGIGIDLFGRGLWLIAAALVGFPLGRFARSSRSESVLAWLVLVLFGACVAVELAGALSTP